MLAILGTINTLIGYVNMNVKIKNRVYTLAALVGNLYMLYVAYRFFANGYPGRGALYLLAFLGLAYFSYLNVLYWFTKTKMSRFDISPKIERIFGIKPKDPEEEARKKVARAGLLSRAGYVQTNGIFKDQHLLEATIHQDERQAAALQQLAHQLIGQKLVVLDFGGVKDTEILSDGTGTHHYPALAEPVALPYFALEQINGRYVVNGGVNQFERLNLGEISTVGLMPIAAASAKYQLALATVVLTGGPYKYAGRNEVMVANQPFALHVQMAYQARTTTAAPEHQSASGQATMAAYRESKTTTAAHERTQARRAEELERRQAQQAARPTARRTQASEMLRHDNGEEQLANHQWDSARTPTRSEANDDNEGLSRVKKYHR